jgi:hypothetical protein
MGRKWEMGERGDAGDACDAASGDRAIVHPPRQ